MPAKRITLAAHRVAVAPELDSEEDVQRRLARGELVKHRPGPTPVDEAMVAQLRAHMARPRERPRKDS